MCRLSPTARCAPSVSPAVASRFCACHYSTLSTTSFGPRRTFWYVADQNNDASFGEPIRCLVEVSDHLCSVAHAHTQHTLSSYFLCTRVDDSSIIHVISAASRRLPFSHASLLFLPRTFGTFHACVPSALPSLPTSSLCQPHQHTHTTHALYTARRLLWLLIALSSSVVVSQSKLLSFPPRVRAGSWLEVTVVLRLSA